MWALFSVLISFCSAQESWKTNYAGKFGGINSFNDSSQISDEDSKSAENVRTDAGYLEKRRGSVRLLQVLDGFSVSHLAQFIPSNGTKYLLAHSSITIYRTDLASAAVAIGTVTVTNNVDFITAYGKAIIADGGQPPIHWDGTSSSTVAGFPICKYMEFADERVYCANIPSESTSRVRVSSFGGVSYWTVPSNVSKVGDAPNSFDFDKDDGDEITCFFKTPWGKFIGKRRKTLILKGYDNLTYYKKTIDPAIGCVDDRSVQMLEGAVIWLAIDGIYAWGGSGPPVLISNDIDDIVKLIRELNSVTDSWSVDSKSEWDAGSYSANGQSNSWDSSTTPGSIFASSQTFVDTSSTNFAAGTLTNVTTAAVTGSLTLSSTTVRDNFEDGNYTSNIVWTVTGSGDFQVTTIASSKRLSPDGSISVSTIVPSGIAIATGSWAFSYYMAKSGAVANRCSNTSGLTCLDFRFVVSAGLNYYTLRLYSQSASGIGYRLVKNVGNTETVLGDGASENLDPDTAYAFEVQRSTDGRMYVYRDGVFKSSATDTAVSSSTKVEVFAWNDGNWTNTIDDVLIYQYQRHGEFTSRIFDTRFSTPLAGPFSSTFTAVSGETFVYFDIRSSTSPNDDLWSSFSAASDTIRVTQQSRYQQYRIRFSTFISTKTGQVDSVENIYASTGNYRSDVHFIGGDITAWKTVDFSDNQSPSGVLVYYVRSATYSFSAAADGNGIGWYNQTNHLNVGVSTGTYYQFRIDSSSMTSSSQTAIVARHAVYWQEGSVKPVASAVFDRRYYLCVTISTTSVNKDTCLVFQKNSKWVTDTGPSIGSLTVYDNNLVGGSDKTDSYIWKHEQKDVYRDDTSAISSFWKSKDFIIGNPFLKKILHEMWLDAAYSTASVKVGFAINKSQTYTDKSIDLSANTDYVNKRVPIDKGFVEGKYINFRFSNSTIDQYFRVNGYAFMTETKNRTTD